MLWEVAYGLKLSAAFWPVLKVVCWHCPSSISRAHAFLGDEGSQREESGDVSPTQLKSVVAPTSGDHVFLVQSNEPAEAKSVV